ncbi:MAG: FAD-dependent monooxygenase [Crocinitomicaceae bacterium]|jgi:kynurenine 3-monooxygenase|nr:FAD-dependent monooxygenase [Crocinitomicaceae bacterium]
MKKIGIVGAGLVGSLQAIMMAKKGYEVQVFERRPDLRKAGEIGGRSINLALSDRGFKALSLAGVEQKIREIALPMYRRCMHDLEGNLSYQPYGVNNEAIYSVSRGRLNQILMNEAEHYPNISYHFNKTTTDVDLRNKEILFKNEDGSRERVAYDKLFACDGAYSAVRSRMQKVPQFNYNQQYLTHGYKELEIPANPDGTHQMANDCLHIWPRGEFMMIALPNLDGSFTCTLFFPLEGEMSFASLTTEEKVMAFFERTFADSIPLMPELAKDFFDNPTGHLMTVKCSPWQVEDDVLLMGDAAHAVVPFYGQGMNAGFEDCTVFHELYEENKGEWTNLMVDFSDRHYKNGHAIADLALDNYIEMRDKTADPDFLLRKKIENKFTRLHPGKWLPLYSCVTFSHTPYNEAVTIGRKQKKIMDEVMTNPQIHDLWDEEVTMQEILRLLEKEQSYA